MTRPNIPARLFLSLAYQALRALSLKPRTYAPQSPALNRTRRHGLHLRRFPRFHLHAS